MQVGSGVDKRFVSVKHCRYFPALADEFFPSVSV